MDENITKKNRMIFINGFLWVAVGVMLIIRGLPLFPETSSSTFLLALTLGLIIGGAKGLFVLSKTSTRNINRIQNLQDPIKYTAIFPVLLLILIPIMIGFGIALRHFIESIPGKGYTVGAIYVGIGAALVLSSIKYWKACLKKN